MTQTTSRKPVIATTSLAGCFGCHMSLLDMDEYIAEFVEKVELHKSPLTDIKRFSKRCDVGLIEGGCCNDENVEVLHMFREHCDILISVGACAINGGLPAMRNEVGLTACLKEAYFSAPTGGGFLNRIPHHEDIPKIMNKVYPCHEVVKIDYFLPGCPPSGPVFKAAIQALLEGRKPELPTSLIRYD